MLLVLAFLVGALPRAAQPAGERTAPPPSDRPNILFLFADDQRADTIRAWGNEWIDTPNLDRLAAEGLSFERNYVFGSNSGAVCVPSRAMVLTGRNWMRSPNDMRGVPTLPRELEAVGYRTFITGKWHNGEEALLRSFDHGTAVYLGGMADHTQVEVQDIEDGELVRRRVGREFSSELFADAVIAFLDEQARLGEQAPRRGRPGRTSRSSPTCRSRRRTIRASRRPSTASATTAATCRCRPTSCRSTRSTTAP